VTVCQTRARQRFLLTWAKYPGRLTRDTQKCFIPCHRPAGIRNRPDSRAGPHRAHRFPESFDHEAGGRAIRGEAKPSTPQPCQSFHDFHRCHSLAPMVPYANAINRHPLRFSHRQGEVYISVITGPSRPSSAAVFPIEQIRPLKSLPVE